MEYTVHIRMNANLYLRDPDSSELGRKIIRQGILLFADLGFEEATFKKLAERIGTKEASIYRYFESKHRLLIYIVDWYWQWMEYQLVYETHNLSNPAEKLERALHLLLHLDLPDTIETGGSADGIDLKALHGIVVHEASKAYLTHHVTQDNSQHLFKPYKDLCNRLARLIQDVQPHYEFARSLASTLVETAHYQTFFMQHLPSLTSFSPQTGPTQLLIFLRHLLFSALHNPAE